MRRAKIVCTIGPASSRPEMLRDMILAGMDCARLNFSHGSHDDHRQVYDTIRSISQEVGKPVAILQDLQGPKIRVGRFASGPIELVAGEQFVLSTESDVPGDVHRVGTTYEDLHRDVQPGDVLLLDDGLLRLRAIAVEGREVITRVEIGGKLSNNKGINLPNAAVSAPSMSDKDKEDLAFGLELGVDYVALSFVRTALDIHMLRALIGDRARVPHIISKIEKPQAIEELEDIIAVSDGIMIARGDLGVELPPERVPMAQKRAIGLAGEMGCITITATQMLDSMTYNPRPTRAEASDVANAILDGSDAVMLSGETATGKYPIEAIQMMDRIICEVESSEDYRQRTWPVLRTAIHTFPNAVARAVKAAAAELDVTAITLFTNSGATARKVMSVRPTKDIIACTPNPLVLNRMALYWGTTPRFIPEVEGFHDVMEMVEHILTEDRKCKPGDEVIIVMGLPIGSETNLIKFHRLPERGHGGAFPVSKW